MTEPWTYDHIHEPPPPGQINKDRVALAVVMLGVGFGFGIEAVKEVVVRIRGRLKRRK